LTAEPILARYGRPVATPGVTEAPVMDLGALADELARIEPSAAADPGAFRLVRAPGRVNLVGEHTDYNGGLVLPMAIDLAIVIAFVPADDRLVELTLRSTGERASVDLDRLPARDGSWVDYVAGMAWALAEAGLAIHGFRGILAADLPIGAGLSSSAALELAVAWALGGGAAPAADRMALARIAQRAENEFVGVASGLMDQFAVSFGQAGAAALLDCLTLEHRPVPIPDGVAFVVCDSGLPRRLAESAYGDRRAECARALAQIQAAAPSVTSLRDVDERLLAGVGTAMDDIAFRRARHVIGENARVGEAVNALAAGDVAALGRAVSASHASLRDDFEVSTPELDHLVAVATSTAGVLGARLTGAGFGGCTLNVVEPGATEALIDRLNGLEPFPGAAPIRAFEVRAADGVGMVAPSGPRSTIAMARGHE
jgi:galactokinase